MCSKRANSDPIGLAAILLRKEDENIDLAIALLSGPLISDWEREVRLALDTLERRVDALEDSRLSRVPDAFESDSADTEDRLVTDLALTLLAALSARLSTPPAQGLLTLSESLAARLMTGGAIEAGLSVDLAAAGAAQILFRASDDLSFMMGAQKALREPQRIQAHIEDLLKSRSVRRIPAIRAAWRLTAEKILGVPATVWIPGMVEGWAVRWQSIGVAQAAIQAGVTELIAQNPLDSRTSPFCRWVHGKVVSLETAAIQINDFFAAQADGDVVDTFDSWPLLQFDGKETPKDFARMFLGVGLPPYHTRCRTTVRPK